jgi:vacuolar-type H+-ATPase subunit H
MSTTATDTNTTASKGTGTSETGTSGTTSSAKGAASSRAADAYSAARERTSSALSSARDTASRAAERTTARVDTNPVAALVGGLALGGILAWVLPKTQRETEALSGVGQKLTDTAKQAAQTAMDAGRQQVNEIKETAASNIGHAVMEAVSSTTGSGQQGSGQ